MNKELIDAIPQWESEYLRMSKNLTDREKEILKGDSIKSNEGMVLVKCMPIGKNKKVLNNA